MNSHKNPEKPAPRFSSQPGYWSSYVRKFVPGHYSPPKFCDSLQAGVCPSKGGCVKCSSFDGKKQEHVAHVPSALAAILAPENTPFFKK
jgi:hypothetical protein